MRTPREGAPQPASPPRIIGALDIGTNSVLLLVAQTSGVQIERVLFDGERNPRLGQGLGADRRLQPEAMARTADAIASLVLEAPGNESIEWRAAGTSALRDAINRHDFLSAVRGRTGIEVVVISGEREAELTFAGVCSDPTILPDSPRAAVGRDHPPDAEHRRGVGYPLAGAYAPTLRPAAVRQDEGPGPDDSTSLILADIGGGSTEIMWGRGGVGAAGPRARAGAPLLEGATSVDVGSSRLLRRLPAVDPFPDTAAQSLREAAAAVLRPAMGALPASRGARIVLSGGTAKTLLDLGPPTATAEEGLLRRETLEMRLAWLARATRTERLALPGLPPERADTIVAGAAIVLAILDLLGRDEARVSRRGLRYGIAIQERWP